MIINKPKPGYRDSNYRNTTRRVFENAYVSSSNIEVDVKIIKIFQTILKNTASRYTINSELFKEYALKTAYLFVKNIFGTVCHKQYTKY